MFIYLPITAHLANVINNVDFVDQLTLFYEASQLKSVSDNEFAPSQYGIKEYPDNSSSDDESFYDNYDKKFRTIYSMYPI